LQRLDDADDAGRVLAAAERQRAADERRRIRELPLLDDLPDDTGAGALGELTELGDRGFRPRAAGGAGDEADKYCFFGGDERVRLQIADGVLVAFCG